MYKDFLKRKEKVIIQAIDVLDEAGIQGLTTKELARREGITEPAIYKQFDSKQDIILAILDRFAAFDGDIRNTILEQQMTPLQGVLYYVEAYAGYYQSYPQITTVMFSFDVFRYEVETNRKMNDIMNKRYDFITELVAKGQHAGEFSREIGAADLSNIILGLLWSITCRWKMQQKGENLKEQVTKALEWVLREQGKG